MRYGVQGSGRTQTVSALGGVVTETTISGLDFATNYSIEVAAVNNAGIGVYSDTIVFTTESKVLDNLTQYIILSRFLNTTIIIYE